LKSNVIIGRLLPIGEEFKKRHMSDMIVDESVYADESMKIEELTV